MVTDPLLEIRIVETFLGLIPFFLKHNFVYPEVARFPCFKFGGHNLCMDPKCKGQQTGISFQNFMNKLETKF